MSATMLVVEETERWFPVVGWGSRRLPSDRCKWLDRAAGEPATRFQSLALGVEPDGLPPHRGSTWEDGSRWTQTSCGGNAKGWEYAFDFNSTYHPAPALSTDCVRRRVWQRPYIAAGGGSGGVEVGGGDDDNDNAIDAAEAPAERDSTDTAGDAFAAIPLPQPEAADGPPPYSEFDSAGVLRVLQQTGEQQQPAPQEAPAPAAPHGASTTTSPPTSPPPLFQEVNAHDLPLLDLETGDPEHVAGTTLRPLPSGASNTTTAAAATAATIPTMATSVAAASEAPTPTPAAAQRVEDPLNAGFRLASEASTAEANGHLAHARTLYAKCLDQFARALPSIPDPRSKVLIEAQCKEFADAALRCRLALLTGTASTSTAGPPTGTIIITTTTDSSGGNAPPRTAVDAAVVAHLSDILPSLPPVLPSLPPTSAPAPARTPAPTPALAPIQTQMPSVQNANSNTSTNTAGGGGVETLVMPSASSKPTSILTPRIAPPTFTDNNDELLKLIMAGAASPPATGGGNLKSPAPVPNKRLHQQQHHHQQQFRPGMLMATTGDGLSEEEDVEQYTRRREQIRQARVATVAQQQRQLQQQREQHARKHSSRTGTHILAAGTGIVAGGVVSTAGTAAVIGAGVVGSTAGSAAGTVVGGVAGTVVGGVAGSVIGGVVGTAGSAVVGTAAATTTAVAVGVTAGAVGLAASGLVYGTAAIGRGITGAVKKRSQRRAAKKAYDAANRGSSEDSAPDTSDYESED